MPVLPARVWGCVCVALVFACIPSAHAYLHRHMYRPARGFASNGKALDLTGRYFGFEHGGQIQLFVDCDGPTGPLSLVAVTRSQDSDLSDNYEKPCSSTLQFSVVFDLRNYTAAGSTPTAPKYTLEEGFGNTGRRRFYNFHLRECPPIPDNVLRSPPAKCDVLFVTVNPGGEYLSRDEVRIPTIYQAFVWMWAGVLLLWTANWIAFRKVSNRLHRIVAIPPLLKLISLCFELKKYSDLSREGVVSSELEIVRHLFIMAENSTMFVILILICYGWCIVEYRLDLETKMAAFGLSLIFFISSTLTVYVHNYFLGITIIVVIVISVSVLKHAAQNIAFLRERRELISNLTQGNQQNLHASIQPLLSKRHLLAASRVTFTLYAFLWAVLGILSTFLDEYKWLEIILFESLEGLLYLRILWLFRLSSLHKKIVKDQIKSQRKKVQRNIKVFEGPQCETPQGICIPLSQDDFMHYMEHEHKIFARREVSREDRGRQQNNNDAPQNPAQAELAEHVL